MPKVIAALFQVGNRSRKYLNHTFAQIALRTPHTALKVGVRKYLNEPNHQPTTLPPFQPLHARNSAVCEINTPKTKHYPQNFLSYLMIFINTRHRSEATEIMDDFEMVGETLRSSLDQLAVINRWLGGNSVTLGGLKELLEDLPTSVPLRILDLGCGNGDLLRVVAKWGRKTGRPLELIGIDGNAFTVNYAQELSHDFPEISYRAEMIPSPFLAEANYDVVLCTLFLHHFTTEDLQNLLMLLSKQAKTGIVINDLHRSRIAYFLFNLITLFIPNRMVREDGLTSILRGFKKQELLVLGEKLPKRRSRIRWRWAFRYQWILWTR